MPNSENKPVIAIDIDDVIAAHAPAFVKYANDKWGTNLTVDNYQDHWGEVWKVDYEETQKRALEYHSSNYIGTYSVVEGAKNALEQLRRIGKLIIVTTRRKSIDNLTRTWLNKNYPNIFDDVIFAGFFDSPTEHSVHMTKGELAKKIGADYLIDDQLKHCAAAAKSGTKSLLFGDYPWNRTDNLPEGVIRVKNWQEVLEYFDARS